MRIIDAGIYFELESAVYFSDPCPSASLTQSLAKLILDKSPRHAWLQSPQLNPDWTPADKEGYDSDRAIGNAAHAYMLGRGKQFEVMKFTNFRTKDAQEVRDEALDAGRVPILPHHDERARAMVQAASNQIDERFAFNVLFSLEEGDSEAVIACQHKGVWLRSMIDWVSKDRLTVVDYKTGGMNCAPHAIDVKMKSAGVEIQAAFHELILDAIDPANAGRRQHIFVFQENQEPYALNAFPLSEEWMTYGRKQVAMAIDIWRNCMMTKQWPLYPIDSGCPPYPSYQATKLLTREVEYEDRRIPADHLMGG
jgi:PDDEXK-like domain of unknown function (DUF3799)